MLPLKLARKIRKLRARTSHKAKLIRVGAASFDVVGAGRLVVLSSPTAADDTIQEMEISPT